MQLSFFTPVTKLWVHSFVLNISAGQCACTYMLIIVDSVYSFPPCLC